jgi:hypothetical protein
MAPSPLSPHEVQMAVDLLIEGHNLPTVGWSKDVDQLVFDPGIRRGAGCTSTCRCSRPGSFRTEQHRPERPDHPDQATSISAGEVPAIATETEMT